MTRHELAEKLRAEHHALAALARRARSQVRAARDLDRLVALVVKLEEHLGRHLDLEEEGGYMAALLEEAPELAASVARLRAEHLQLRSELADCARAIKQLRWFHDPQWPTLRKQLEAWFNLVQRHETEENALVQRALARDVGTGD